MRKLWFSIFGLLLLAIAAFISLPPSSKREPSYHGKLLSEWLVDAHHLGLGSVDAEPKAEEAVRAIGKEAIPTLLKMLRTKDSPVANELMWLAQHQSIVKIRFNPIEASLWRWRGAIGFRALGPQGREALPEIIKLFRSPGTGYEAAIAISTMGPDTISILRAGLTNKEKWIRIASAQALRYSGSNASVAVPELVGRLGDTSAFVRRTAASSLGSLAQQPDLVLPHLARLLQDSNSSVRRWTVYAISGFGIQATSAVPAIVQAMSETGGNDESFRYEATNALRRIEEARAQPEENR